MPQFDTTDNYQTRRHSGELRWFDTLAEALKDAQDPEVWKVSFGLPNGERVRLVRDDNDDKFVLEQIDLGAL